jgi:AraC-like DNA-binding protein
VLGSVPRVVGPLTSATVEILAPGTTLIGVRFLPGAATAVLGLPGSALLDQTVPLNALWGPRAVMLAEVLSGTESAEAALSLLQQHLLVLRAAGPRPDPLVAEAVRQLMPWRIDEIGPLSWRLAISESQLRRRCRAVVGIGPKTLQRTLRFQGFLALVQSAGQREDPLADGLASLAVEAGYADHPHLSRECLRLTGLPPSAFWGGKSTQCDCGHDHSASYSQILSSRPMLIRG